MAKIAVYLTGSIAAYKGIEVIRGLQKQGHHVRVAMTVGATRLIAPATLYALTKEPVLTNLWDQQHHTPIPHIELADWSDLAVVVPASADIIAKVAQGLADDAVSTTLLATAAPKIVVPAMNTHMWNNPATQRNLKQLQNDGIHIIWPVTGQLAEGYQGQGRLPEPAQICDQIQEFLSGQQLLANRQVVITAGGTQEPLDPVRFIGNHSSGKMGVALARAAAQAGAKVTLIVASVSVSLPQSPQIKIIKAITGKEMLAQVKEHFRSADILIMAAAVADYRPLTIVDHKIKKQVNHPQLTLELTETVDILKTIGQSKQPGQLVIGFAAETNDLLTNANRKLASKNADMIVANSVAGDEGAFGNDEDQVTILQLGQEPLRWPRQSKEVVAKQLIKLISEKIKPGD